MGYKAFQAFTKLTAQDTNTYLMNQSVMTFASTSDRTTQLTGITLVEGMVSYLQDVNRYDYYNGSAWQPLTGQAPAAIMNNGSTGLSIANSSVTQLTFSTAVTNRDVSYAAGVFTATYAGYYSMSVSGGWASNATGQREIGLRVPNGTQVLGSKAPAGATSVFPQTFTTTYYLGAGATFDFYAWQNSGGALTIGDATWKLQTVIRYLGD